jgi:UDP-N-acetylglucosamine 3-dehydrogenase
MVTRVAVIGVGSMGSNHVRVFRDLDNVDLVAVADRDVKTTEAIAGRYGVRAYADFQEMIDRERPHAVTVAVPTSAHYSVAKCALERGCHVLVEKPIAATLEEAQQLVAVRPKARVLMVGHIERFNPAVIELKRRLANGELGRIFQIQARRWGPFPPRIRDVGIVIDLATHDLDIMRYLSNSEAIHVYAQTNRALKNASEDMVTGVIRFKDDMLGLVDINWLTPTKIRELTVTGDLGMFRVDYLTQDLYFFQNSEANRISWEALSVIRGVSEGTMTRFPISKKEPLRAELEAFIAAVEGRIDDVVSGEDGLTALALALALIESSAQGKPVEPRTTVAVANVCD